MDIISTTALRIITVFKREAPAVIPLKNCEADFLPKISADDESILRQISQEDILIMLGKLITATAIIPKAPTVFFAMLTEPTSDVSASLTAPPTIGIKLPETNLALLSTAVSAAPARTPFTVSNPEKTVAAKPNNTVADFLIILQREFSPNSGAMDETMFREKNILINGEIMLCAT